MHPKQAVKKIYTLAKNQAVSFFGSRLISVYLIGSLAHGGFSEVSSDIDIAFILDNKDILEEDWDMVNNINKDIKATGLEFSKKLSIFWTNVTTISNKITSGGFPPPTKKDGLFPPFDILDLYQNGVLIYGKDIKSNILVPNEENLFIAGTEFLLSYVDNKKRNECLSNVDIFLELNPVDISKNILFPIRLLFTLFTSKIGSNGDAALYFLSKKDTSEKLKELINQAIYIRNSAQYHTETLKELFPNLNSLYINLIDLHIKKMEELQNLTYVQMLKDWRSRILII
ncbi:MAG: nucleotidyltransferase domain-containing protein [Candidatus Taylorbacteria bacterium]|nr:nucleotidyltransferase domain-containing protein [Candidatus Taylorbacteria bacterium]